MRELIQQKADLAVSVGASGAVVTWVHHANQYVDFVAGILAIVASACAIAWYIKKWNDGREHGTTSNEPTEGSSSE